MAAHTGRWLAQTTCVTVHTLRFLVQLIQLQSGTGVIEFLWEPASRMTGLTSRIEFLERHSTFVAIHTGQLLVERFDWRSRTGLVVKALGLCCGMTQGAVVRNIMAPHAVLMRIAFDARGM